MASAEPKNERGLGRVGSLRTWLKPSSFFLSRDYGVVYNRALFFCYSRVDKKKKKEVIVPFERYWSFNSERHQKLLSLSPLTPFQGLINDKDVRDYCWNVY